MTDRDALIQIIDRLARCPSGQIADAVLDWVQGQGFRRVDATVIWAALRATANSDLVRAAEVERALLAAMGPPPAPPAGGCTPSMGGR